MMIPSGLKLSNIHICKSILIFTLSKFAYHLNEFENDRILKHSKDCAFRIKA